VSVYVLYYWAGVSAANFTVSATTLSFGNLPRMNDHWIADIPNEHGFQLCSTVRHPFRVSAILMSGGVRIEPLPNSVVPVPSFAWHVAQ
jgi:hypothetical protein